MSPTSRAHMPAQFTTHLGLDLALLGHDAGGAAVPGEDARDLAILEDFDPAHASPLGKRHSGIRRVGLAVMGEEDGADHIVDVEQRPHLLRLLRRDLLRLDTEGLGHGRTPAELVPALGIGGDGDAAVLLQPGRLARLLLQLGIELQAVPGEPGQIAAIEHGPHQTRRMPGRAAGELLALQEQHVLLAELGEVVSDGTADDAAADDDDLGLGRKPAHE